LEEHLKAIALFSGGLDSILAMKLIQEQNIEIIALNINIGFGSKQDKKDELEKVCQNIGVEFLQIDIREQYLDEVLFSPKYGYGKYFNPCIDCHANMFRVAKNILDEVGASFLISGEVVGQRPMSQNKDALNSVLNLGNIEGLLVRPLSAKLLKPTIPEINGWIDRNKLLDISGRSRITQIELAKKYNLEDYESPAGGCLLTDRNFANKIKDFIKYDKLTVSDIDLLKFGRHFRLKNGAKLVVGKNHDDNLALKQITSDKFDSLEALGVSSPYSWISKNSNSEDFEFALRILLTYTKAEVGQKYKVIKNNQQEFWAEPFEDKKICHQFFIYQ
jgi:tRNA-specific 2-thiouridylase